MGKDYPIMRSCRIELQFVRVIGSTECFVGPSPNISTKGLRQGSLKSFLLQSMMGGCLGRRGICIIFARSQIQLPMTDPWDESRIFTLLIDLKI